MTIGLRSSYVLVVFHFRRRFVVGSFPCPVVVLFAGGHLVSGGITFCWRSFESGSIPCPGFVRFLGVGDVGLVLGI